MDASHFQEAQRGVVVVLATVSSNEWTDGCYNEWCGSLTAAHIFPYRGVLYAPHTQPA